MGDDTIDKLVTQLRKKTGIQFHAHQFQHTYATNLVLDGMNPYHVMTLTRHKLVQSFRLYTKAADQKAAEAAFYETQQRKKNQSSQLEQ
ncbi:site-specific integrase [Phormidium tenue FACHB-886]|nr:site-specific integrase [Phormidium tenue FACHB-886]